MPTKKDCSHFFISIEKWQGGITPCQLAVTRKKSRKPGAELEKSRKPGADINTFREASLKFGL